MSPETSPPLVQETAEAAEAVKHEYVLLRDGGPIATPDGAAYVLARWDGDGVVGVSPIERLTVATSMAATTSALNSTPSERDGRE
ncbi:MAG: phosphoenolpyruvate hydrolase family protein [Phycisphaerae bacterium]|nr:phosphoenolpyruvate hydrolase family protein [Phycisphaerae bacterium]MDZ4780267.1 phosphoenolpyruvate hydrolase family protein [Planctomycetia bacterium]